MQGLQWKRVAFAAALAVVSLAPAMAKDGGADAMPARATMTFDGPIMVTPAGMSLYTYSTEDSRSDKFKWQCTDVVPRTINDQQSGIGPRPEIGFKHLSSCVQKYPPYLASADAQPVGDFTIVKRPDGSRQWAYQGFPLYLSSKDVRPGDRNAAAGAFPGGRGGFRMAPPEMVLPTGFKFLRQERGLVLATVENDRAVYTPRGDARMRLTSTNGLEFKALVAPAIASVRGEWSIIEEGAGRKQYAYRGKPLYLAPAGVLDDDIVKTGGWEPVVVAKGPEVPSAIGRQLTLMGDVYTDKKGMTLYTYGCSANGGAGTHRTTAVPCDDAGDPAAFMVALCGDAKECARRWRPYIAPANAKPEGEFSIVDITYPMFTDVRGKLFPSDAPRVKAWAYRGKPLFTYYEDEKPSDIWGDSIGGIWGSRWSALLIPGRSATQLEP